MNPPSDETVLGIESLDVRYGKTVVLENVSLAVARGEVYALLGRNGCGKTSLVRCLLGHQRAARGRSTLFGEDSWKRRTRLMGRVGVVPEEPDAPPALTARQLGRFCSRLYPRWDGPGFSGRLRRFEVPLDRAFHRLSKGQKGQVMLALALAPSPELLVLDDPTLGLDVVARKTIFEDLVGELADRGVTVFLTSHDLAGIEGIASRVGLLRRGERAARGESQPQARARDFSPDQGVKPQAYWSIPRIWQRRAGGKDPLSAGPRIGRPESCHGQLCLDEELEPLKARFRRLSWGSDAAEGGEPPAEVEPAGAGALAAMDPLDLRPRGRGWEAIVARFDDRGFERLRRAPGVGRAEAAALSLEEIVIALTDDEKGG